MIYKKYCENQHVEPLAYSKDQYGRSIIDYSGRPGDYEYVALADVLEGKIDPRAFSDCIVLVGFYNRYSGAAKEFARERKIGLYDNREFFGAVNCTGNAFLNYVRKSK
jgi:adenylate cyclase